MSKHGKSGQDRSVKIGNDATGNVIVTGDASVVSIGGGQSAGQQRDHGVAKVFISSTSEDLKQHRTAARDAAIAAGFLPIQMEYFAASGQHPPLQACLDKVAEADVVVLIIAHRYGWVPPDQDGGQDKSITWLECEKAVADKKELLALVVDEQHTWDDKLRENYRIAAAVSEGKATPELLAEVQRNVERLQDFKSWIDSIGVRAKFTTPEDLGWKVSESLREWKQRLAKPSKQPLGKSLTSRQRPTVPPAYREWLQRQCADIDLLGVQLRQGQAVKLNHVYVPLITTPAQEDSAPVGMKSDRSTSQDAILAERDEKPQLLLEQLDKHSLYVPGDPGSGKSTFCRWVAWLVAAGSMPPSEVAAPEHYVEPFPQTLAQRMPLFLRLRDVWKSLPQDAGRDSLCRLELESALGSWLDTTSPGGLKWADVAPHLEHGSALLIFDGVDEVPLRMGEGRQACYPRAMLLAGLTDAAAVWQQQGNRVLITSRPYGIDERQERNLPWQSSPIRELDNALQKLLVHRWFRILKDDVDEATTTATDMVQHLAERPELGTLIANPMLLTAMCIIFSQGKRLPQDKHDLYEQIVENVLYNRYRNDMSELEMAREHLGVVAYGMHTGAGLGQQRTTPQAEASYRDIERMIQTYHDESAVTFTGYRNALDTRDELLQRSGLLLDRGDKKAGFYHYTFQDFLAARRIADIQRDRLFDVFVENAGVAEWRNTLSFLFSSELANSREQATRLMNRLIEQLTPDRVGLAVVAADCLETMLGRDSRLRQDVEEQFKNVCLAAIDDRVEVKARHTLGIALGRLGDPRIVTDLRDPAAYVEIAAGKYTIGDNDKAAYESYLRPLDEQQFDVQQRFLLSRYPVTNSQFAFFIKEGGYTNRDLWSEEGWQWQEKQKHTEPEYWGNTKYNGPNQPVVGVSWYEAEAFCKWAGGFLPSEGQWEAAARGSEELAYPWGPNWEDGICNTRQAGLGVTSPVGMFPRSKSRDSDLQDMAGNVWEWCADKHEHHGRVLRGGSFTALASGARGASRLNSLPGNRNGIFGFRVART